jgi:hypothetical protein
MEPDDEAPLTLSKWPFYLGDSLLVGIALAIATLGGWQLSNWQVASCVMAVALGAALFVLPYVVEYHMRRGEAADDRTAEMRLLQAHLKRFEAALVGCHERIEALESASGSARQYELLAAAVDQKFATAAQTVAGLSAQLAVSEAAAGELRAALDALQAQFDGLSTGADNSTAGGAELDAFQARVAELETRLTQVVEPIESIDSRLQTLEAAAKESSEKRAPRPSRQRRAADSGLLHRAMQEKQDSSSTAVSRIIDAKLKRQQAAELPNPEPSVAATTEPTEPTATPDPAAVLESTDHIDAHDGALEASEPVAKPPADGEGEAEAVAGAPVEQDALPEVNAVSQDTELGAETSPLESDDEASAVEPLPEAGVVETGEVVEVLATGETPAAPQLETSMEAEACEEVAIAEAPPEDLFGEVVRPLPSRASVKKNDAVFTVSILIGIGNKPYLRGSGGGLNWDAGVPMEFEEIGKWRWVAPADLDEPVELRVFRNDEDADRKGTHILQPGQKLEVTPVF